MHGAALPGSLLSGGSLVRLWLGPAAAAAVGYELTPRLSLRVTAELGVIATGVTSIEL